MNKRRTGRTTRLIDAAIQEFFENGFCIVRDHAHDIGFMAIDDMAFRIMMRLEIEHEIASARKYNRQGHMFIIDDEIELDNCHHQLLLERKLNEKISRR